MGEFKYKAKNLDNKTIKGRLEAKNKDELFGRLKAQGYVAFSITEVVQDSVRPVRLKSLELAEFSRNVGTMLGSGISIIKTISIMKEQAATKNQKLAYQQLYEIINEGNTLSYAMQKLENTFPELMINMYRSGEVSGGLEKSAMKMAEYYEKDHRLNGKIKMSMAYPLVLLGLTIGVVLLMYLVILPNFFTLFDNFKIELPLITKIVLGMSKAVSSYWYLLLAGVVILVAGVRKAAAIPKVAVAIDAFKLKIPKIGKLLRIIYTARFARTLSALYSRGVNMMDSVDISAKIIGNKYVAGQFPDVVSRIKNGNQLSASLKDVIGIDTRLASSVSIGEETGRLDDMLNSMADSYDYDAEVAVAKLLTYIEPLMIIIMAGVVGVTILSILLPMFQIYSSI